MIREEPKRLAPTTDTLTKLFAKSGNRCAYPGCNAPLVDDENIFIGQICHIQGVKGERFNPDMTNEDRRQFNNLILFCYPHHRKTNNEQKYTVNILEDIKKQHEELFKEPYNIDETVIQNIYNELRSIKEDTEEILQTVKRQELQNEIQSANLNAILDLLNAKDDNEVDTPVLREIEAIVKLKNASNYFSTIELLEKIRDDRWDKLNHTEKYKVLANIGLCYLTIHEVEKASKLLIEAVKYNQENHKALSLSALGYALQGNKVECKKYIDKAVAISPESVYAYVSLIMISQDDKNIQQLIDEIPESILKNPEINYALGIFENRNGNNIEAIKWLQQALENAKGEAGYIKAAFAAITLEMITDPFIILSGQIDDNIKDKLKHSINLINEAWDELKDIKIQKRNTWYLVNRGTAKSLMNDLPAAYEDLKLAYDLNPDEVFTLKNLAVVAFENGKTDESLRVIEELKGKSQGQEKNDADLLSAEILTASNQFEEAINILKDLLTKELSPDIKEHSIRVMVKGFIRNSQFNEAVVFCNDLIKDDESNIQGYICAAKVQRAMNDRKAAIKFLDKGNSKINSTSKKIIIQELAQEYFHSKQYLKSAEILKGITNTKLYSNINKALIKSYYEAGEIGKALEICEQLKENYGPIDFITEIQCNIYNAIHDLPNAIKVCEEHLSIYPDDQSTLINLIILHAQSRNWDIIKGLVAKYPLIEDKIHLQNVFQVAKIFCQIGELDRGLELAYTVRKRHFEDGKIHQVYVNFLMSIHSLTHSIETIEEVRLNTFVQLLLDDINEIAFIVSHNNNLEKNEISISSPFGVALINKRIGDVFYFENEAYQIEKYKVVGIISKYFHASHESLKLLNTKYKRESHFKSFEIGNSGDFKKDFKVLFDQIDKRQESIDALHQYYLKQQITIGGYSYKTGINHIKCWGNFVSNTKLGINSDLILSEDYIAQTNSTINSSQGFVIDLISLLTIASIKQLHLLEILPQRKVVAITTIEEIEAFIEEEKISQRGGYHTIGKYNNYYSDQEITSSQITESIIYYEKLIMWVKEHCDILPAKEALNINANKKKLYNDTLGRPSIDSILLSKELNYLLLADELIIRDIARNDYQIQGFSNYLLLNYSINNKLIEKDIYYEGVKSLLCYNYKHIPINAPSLFKCVELTDFKTIFPFTLGIQSLGVFSTQDSAIRVAVDFIILLYSEKGRKNCEGIINAVLNELITGRQPTIVIETLVTLLDDRLIVFRKIRGEIVQIIRHYCHRTGIMISI